MLDFLNPLKLFELPINAIVEATVKDEQAKQAIKSATGAVVAGASALTGNVAGAVESGVDAAMDIVEAAAEEIDPGFKQAMSIAGKAGGSMLTTGDLASTAVEVGAGAAVGLGMGAVASAATGGQVSVGEGLATGVNLTGGLMGGEVGALAERATKAGQKAAIRVGAAALGAGVATAAADDRDRAAALRVGASMGAAAGSAAVHVRTLATEPSAEHASPLERERIEQAEYALLKNGLESAVGAAASAIIQHARGENDAMGSLQAGRTIGRAAIDIGDDLAGPEPDEDGKRSDLRTAIDVADDGAAIAEALVGVVKQDELRQAYRAASTSDQSSRVAELRAQLKLGSDLRRAAQDANEAANHALEYDDQHSLLAQMINAAE